MRDIFPGATITPNYRSVLRKQDKDGGLRPLEIDIFLRDFNLGFEYQVNYI